MVTYELRNLPEDVKDTLLVSRHAVNVEEHRKEISNKKFFKNNSSNEGSLLDLLDDSPIVDVSPLKTQDDIVLWATDNYADRGEKYNFNCPIHDVSIIVPRVDKSKEEQKRRVKEKAEVFTPSWVCNEQNNLIDDHILKPGSFNKVSEDKRTWTPTKKPVSFPKGYNWVDYVIERRLEMTAGEAPYLMSPYDTTSGKGIPVRDEKGLFRRIGILDRKLRVVSENIFKELKKNSSGKIVETISDEIKDQWTKYAMLAMVNTFGYEWQGDNLLLARLNFLNTFIEYYYDAFDETPSLDKILDAAEIASWNLWQMDGLKMVKPMSCSENCVACKKKKRAGHDGDVSVFRVLTSKGFVAKTFEELLPSEMFVK